jgi:carbamoyltransferase
VVILAKPYFTLEPDGRLELHHVPVPREPLRIEGDRASRAHVDRFGSFSTLRALVNRLGPGVKDRIQRATRYQPLPAYDRPEGADWKLLEAIVARWAAESRAPVVVVPVPLYQYVEQTASPAAYQARFASLGALRGVEVHDPLPDFHRYSAEERRGFRYRVDCHLTPSAHRVLAESLARRIAPRVREALGRAA